MNLATGFGSHDVPFSVFLGPQCWRKSNTDTIFFSLFMIRSTFENSHNFATDWHFVSQEIFYFHLFAAGNKFAHCHVHRLFSHFFCSFAAKEFARRKYVHLKCRGRSTKTCEFNFLSRFPLRDSVEFVRPKVVVRVGQVGPKTNSHQTHTIPNRLSSVW